jgi:hypothetical protein
MKSLSEFKSSLLDKEQLFNTMANQILGGNTESNGQTTKSKGDDCDTKTSDSDTGASFQLCTDREL